MAYLRDQVIVLKNEPFREHDSWVTCYGLEHGKLVAVARGQRRWGAKHLGHLEPFTVASLMIAGGEAFDKIAVATTLQPRIQMRQRLAALWMAGAGAALTDRLTHPGAPDQHVYELLNQWHVFLDTLVSTPSVERGRVFLAWFCLHLLDLLGYAVDLDHCIVCHQPLMDPVWFWPHAGGMVCDMCMREKGKAFSQATRLPDQTLRVLRFARQSTLETLSRLTISTHLMGAACQVVEACFIHHAPQSSRQTTRLSSAGAHVGMMMPTMWW